VGRGVKKVGWRGRGVGVGGEGWGRVVEGGEASGGRKGGQEQRDGGGEVGIRRGREEMVIED